MTAHRFLALTPQEKIAHTIFKQYISTLQKTRHTRTATEIAQARVAELPSDARDSVAEILQTEYEITTQGTAESTLVTAVPDAVKALLTKLLV